MPLPGACAKPGFLGDVLELAVAEVVIEPVRARSDSGAGRSSTRRAVRGATSRSAGVQIV